MTENLVLTFMARDRTGLVETVADVVADHGGNWLESRMAHLANKFAGIARVEVPKARVDEVRQALEALEDDGIHILVDTSREGKTPGEQLIEIELVGPDSPGILRDITGCIAAKGGSVEELQTEIRDAPMAGGTLFHAKGRVWVPAGMDADEMDRCLEEVAGTLMVDISVQAVDPG